MEIPIVYFSSSNNTAYVAKLIAKGIESAGPRAELVRVEDAGSGKRDVSGAAVIGVGAPIYGGFAEPIQRWAEGFDFSGKKVFLFSTAGRYHFGATQQMIYLVEKRGGRAIGALEMTFPGAGDGVFLSRRLAEKHPLKKGELERAVRFGREVAEISQAGRGYADYSKKHLLGARAMPAIYALKRVISALIKRFIFEENCGMCTNCQACAKVCPVDAIRTKDKCAEIDRSKCIACFRCFKQCPSGALTLRFAGGRPYYRGPWQLEGYVRPEDLGPPPAASKRP